MPEPPEPLSHADRQLWSQSPHKDAADEIKHPGIKNSARLLGRMSANTFRCSFPPVAHCQDGCHSETDSILVFHGSSYFRAKTPMCLFRAFKCIARIACLSFFSLLSNSKFALLLKAASSHLSPDAEIKYLQSLVNFIPVTISAGQDIVIVAHCVKSGDQCQM